eukprot:5446650-Heterocapsa_arctica.AAC.1
MGRPFPRAAALLARDAEEAAIRAEAAMRAAAPLPASGSDEDPWQRAADPWIGRRLWHDEPKPRDVNAGGGNLIGNAAAP